MPDLPTAFWIRVDNTVPDACWPWVGEIRKPSGLPAFRKELANRLMWESVHGGLPEKQAIATTCGLRHCVNPAHLTLKALGKPPSGDEVRFWSHVNKTDSCWLWTGGEHTSGYGRIGLHEHNNRMEYAHRYSYALHFGELPDDVYVAHTCDVKMCVNPAHLFKSQGNLENMADAATKRRIAHGERSARSKLTDAEVAEIRARAATGAETQAQIAEDYDITRAYVSELAAKTKRPQAFTVPLPP